MYVATVTKTEMNPIINLECFSNSDQQTEMEHFLMLIHTQNLKICILKKGGFIYPLNSVL